MTARLSLTARTAGPGDMEQVRDVLEAAADELTALYGRGHWSGVRTLMTLRQHARDQTVVLVEDGDQGPSGPLSGKLPVATFTLSDRRIPFYRTSWFAAPKAPAIYLTAMAVLPECQRVGVGRWCMARAEELAVENGARAVRLDAYQGRAGAGGFYRRCGYTLVHEGPLGLEFFEKVLS